MLQEKAYQNIRTHKQGFYQKLEVTTKHVFIIPTRAPPAR